MSFGTEILAQHSYILLETAPMAVTVWDNKGQNVDCNAKTLELFKLPSKQAYKESFYGLSPSRQPDGHSSTESSIYLLQAALIENIAPFEWMHKDSEGNLIPCLVSLNKLEFEGKPFIISYVQDLREKKYMEQEILLRNLEISHSADLLGAVNKAATELLNSGDDIFDASMQSALGALGFASMSHTLCLWKNVVSHDGSVLGTLLHRWSIDPNSLIIEKESEPSTLQTGQVDYKLFPESLALLEKGVCINRLTTDVGPSLVASFSSPNTSALLLAPILFAEKLWGVLSFERHSMQKNWSNVEEDALRVGAFIVGACIRRHELNMALKNTTRQAQAATKAKSDFLAKMSHELRTPMNAILGMSYLGLQDASAAAGHEYIQKIQTAAYHLMNILTDLLDFSSIENKTTVLECKPFSIRKLIHSLYDEEIKSIAHDKGLTVGMHINPLLHDYFEGDAACIRQVFKHILSNAIKFTSQGSVQVFVEGMHKNADNIDLLVRISDTGIGMSADELACIFEPFSQSDGYITRRYGGTGLGLVICKELLSLMAGSIQVDSSPGKGSTFSFTLNLRSIPCLGGPDDPDCLAMDDTYLGTLRNKKALVVEDNTINCLIVKTILKDTGMLVDTAENGLQALQAVRCNKYDIVLMDIQMPIMDGLEATRRIRDLPLVNKNLPIVAMTAHALPEDRVKSRQAGMNEHITKPFDPQHLLHIIFQLCK